MLMVTCLPSLRCLVVSAKDVPSHLCCIFLLQKLQPFKFFPIPVSLAFPFPISQYDDNTYIIVTSDDSIRAWFETFFPF